MLTGNRLSSSVLDTIFEHSFEEIYVFDQEGKVIYKNNTAKKSYVVTAESSVDSPVYIQEVYPDIFSDKDYINLLQEKAFINNEASTYFETLAYCNNQTSYPVKLEVVMLEQKEEAAGICYSIRVDEKQGSAKEKVLKEEINRALNVKNEFLANITHELRTPVNGIRGLASNLLDTNLNSCQLETVNIIINSCDNMSKIVNDILDFSKITAGKLILEKREFDFRKLVKTSVSYHASKIYDKGLFFMLKIGENIPLKLIGDEIRLGQIMNNFLSNAVKFTSIGQITMEIENLFSSKNEIELMFAIKDTGIGISKEEQAKLFLSFSQVDGSITRRFGGTGLGLAISKRLIDQMAGTVRVESTKGVGSTFTFTVRLDTTDSLSQDKNVKLEAGQFTLNSDGRLVRVRKNKSIAECDNIEEDVPHWNEKRSIQFAKENLDKLVVYVEKGRWERAEVCSDIIKNQFPNVQDERRKCAFRLELAIRKEDYTTTNERIKELMNLL